MNDIDDPLRPVVAAYAALFEQLAAVTTGRFRRGPGGTVLAVSGSAVSALNLVVSPALVPDPEEVALLAAAGSPWEVPWSIQVRGVPGPRLAAVAAGYGLTAFSSEPLMVRPAELGPPEPPAAGDLRVRAVPVEEFGRYAEAVTEGFQAPAGTFELLADPVLAKLDGVAFHLAEVDGIPVGTGMTAVSGGLTGIFNVTTLPSHRRRGYGRAVTAELVRAGFAAGGTTAYLYASEMGASVYASLGFRTREHLTVITAPS
jgi:GNAT superfamily N-acetyltransferase